jgi:hypothetical protein
VWNDPAIDAARLEAVFGGYKELQLEWPEPVVEVPAGSLYCTGQRQADRRAGSCEAAVEGTLQLKRRQRRPGATRGPAALDAALEHVRRALERSDGSKP